MRHKRTKIWIDQFQTKLSLRIAFHFALYQIAVWALVGIERQLAIYMEAMGGEAWFGLRVVQASTVVLLGAFFVFDAIRFSHRFVGPLYRFRKTIQAITAGEELDLVALRKSDFLQELKDDFNEMLKVLEARGAVALMGTDAKEGEVAGEKRTASSFPRPHLVP